MPDCIAAEPGEIADQPLALKRSVGLAGAVAIVVGGVIGIGVFLLVGPAGAHAGPSLWLAILLAIFFSLVSTLPIIQLASALPRAGGGYFFTSRLLSPALAMLTSNWAFMGGVFSNTLISLGMAQYLSAQFSIAIPPNLLAAAALALLYGAFLFGVNVAMWLQIIMVAQLSLALLMYCIMGLFHFDLEISLTMPQGGLGFFMAVVLCYSISLGFQVISEMGEEIKQARRNIPLALLIGGLVVMGLYILVAMVFLASIPYDFETLKAMQAPLHHSAGTFLPGWLVLFLLLGAMSAALTSLNAAATTIPRELFAQARDGMLPALLKTIHPRTRTPLNAISFYFVVVILLALCGPGIDFCGCMVAVGISMLSIIVSIACLRLPRRFPQRYQSAYLRIPLPILLLCTLSSVVCSVGFSIIVILEKPLVILLYAIWTILILAWYKFRVAQLQKRGIDINEVIKTIPGLDEEKPA